MTTAAALASQVWGPTDGLFAQMVEATFSNVKELKRRGSGFNLMSLGGSSPGEVVFYQTAEQMRFLLVLWLKGKASSVRSVVEAGLTSRPHPLATPLLGKIEALLASVEREARDRPRYSPFIDRREQERAISGLWHAANDLALGFREVTDDLEALRASLRAWDRDDDDFDDD
jgi:hypothetical protein